MKIVVIARTLNESRNISRFCKSYQWADKILVADGGSSDDTVSQAVEFPNVQVQHFSQSINLNGVYRNPHGEHLNLLIRWAKAEEADWIIHDDVDCFPNYLVKNDGQDIFVEAEKHKYLAVYLTRLYLYKDQGHFTRMAQPIKRGKWEQGLWAWKAESPMWFQEDIPVSEHQKLAWTPPDYFIFKLPPPYCLLHCPWQDDEMIERKLHFYRTSGEVPNMIHPLESRMELEPLPEWAREE